MARDHTGRGLPPGRGTATKGLGPILSTSPCSPSHLKEKHRTPDRDEISTPTGEPRPTVASGVEMQLYFSQILRTKLKSERPVGRQQIELMVKNVGALKY